MQNRLGLLELGNHHLIYFSLFLLISKSFIFFLSFNTCLKAWFRSPGHVFNVVNVAERSQGVWLNGLFL